MTTHPSARPDNVRAIESSAQTLGNANPPTKGDPMAPTSLPRHPGAMEAPWLL